MSLTHYLSYLFPQVIKRTHSDFNADIKVIEFCGDLRLIVNSCHQSGGLIRWLWDKVFDKAKLYVPKLTPQKILLLGFAGGTVAHIIAKKWPQANITAVEIDPVMIRVARSYFAIDTINNLNLINANAFEWIKQNNQIYDLIIIDLFFGPLVPPSLLQPDFLQNIRQRLSVDGVVFANIYNEAGNQQLLADFPKQSKKTFNTINQIQIYKNIFFVLQP